MHCRFRASSSTQSRQHQGNIVHFDNQHTQFSQTDWKRRERKDITRKEKKKMLLFEKELQLLRSGTAADENERSDAEEGHSATKFPPPRADFAPRRCPQGRWALSDGSFPCQF